MFLRCVSVLILFAAGWGPWTSAHSQNATGLSICMQETGTRFHACMQGCPGQQVNGTLERSQASAFYVCQKHCLDNDEKAKISCRAKNGYETGAQSPTGSPSEQA